MLSTIKLEFAFRDQKFYTVINFFVSIEKHIAANSSHLVFRLNKNEQTAKNGWQNTFSTASTNLYLEGLPPLLCDINVEWGCEFLINQKVRELRHLLLKVFENFQNGCTEAHFGSLTIQRSRKAI